jgi:hypothetical protein
MHSKALLDLDRRVALRQPVEQRDCKHVRAFNALTCTFAPLAGLEPAPYGLEVRHHPSGWCRPGASPQVGSGLLSTWLHPGRHSDNDRIASWIASYVAGPSLSPRVATESGLRLSPQAARTAGPPRPRPRRCFSGWISLRTGTEWRSGRGSVPTRRTPRSVRVTGRRACGGRPACRRARSSGAPGRGRTTGRRRSPTCPPRAVVSRPLPRPHRRRCRGGPSPSRGC